MFPIQSLGVECKVCLSHAGGSKVTKPIFSNSIKRYLIKKFQNLSNPHPLPALPLTGLALIGA